MSVRVSIVDGALPERGREAAREGAGAVVVFEGVVRAGEGDGVVEALEYEVYEPMAESELARLAREAVERFGVMAVEVEHSRGRVEVGGCSFRLVVEGAHRRESLDATDWFIDRMKRDAPIWKRPVWSGSRVGDRAART